eukprot:SAG31_NODE_199_length_20573_cov_5.832129_2_plen_151_part_00
MNGGDYSSSRGIERSIKFSIAIAMRQFFDCLMIAIFSISTRALLGGVIPCRGTARRARDVDPASAAARDVDPAMAAARGPRARARYDAFAFTALLLLLDTGANADGHRPNHRRGHQDCHLHKARRRNAQLCRRPGPRSNRSITLHRLATD